MVVSRNLACLNHVVPGLSLPTELARYRVRKYLYSTVYCVWYSGVVLFVLECDVLRVLPGS
jgi:hypothetical protein